MHLHLHLVLGVSVPISPSTNGILEAEDVPFGHDLHNLVSMVSWTNGSVPTDGHIMDNNLTWDPGASIGWLLRPGFGIHQEMRTCLACHCVRSSTAPTSASSPNSWPAWYTTGDGRSINQEKLPLRNNYQIVLIKTTVLHKDWTL
jgi:hypothetical protein